MDYPEYSAKENKHSDLIFKCLKNMDRVLTENNITHWITFGTLLGAVRENDIIKYDHDFDMSVFMEDKDKVMGLKEELKKYKLSLRIRRGGSVLAFPRKGRKWRWLKPKCWHVCAKLRYKKRPIADIYFYQRFNDGFLRRYCPEQEIYYLPSRGLHTWYVEELDFLRIRDEMFPAPRNAETLLRFHYNDWENPRRGQRDGGNKTQGYLFYSESKQRDFKPVVDLVERETGQTIEQLKEKYNAFPEWPRLIQGISWYKYKVEKKFMKTYEKEFWNYNSKKNRAALRRAAAKEE